MIRQILQYVSRLWERTPWQVLLLFFAVPFLIRNLLLPMVGDDFSYAFIWDGEHYGNLMDDIGPRQRISSLYDILVSQWSHYFTWGGRTFSMFFIQLFAWIGKVWFDLANTAVFVMLMLVLYWLAIGKIETIVRHKGALLWVMLCILFGVLDYPTTMLWMTGACVYHWTGLMECAFLLALFSGKCKTALPLLGLMAGWSEEAGSLVTVMIAACFLYYSWRQQRLNRSMVLGFAFLLTGCALLLLCPGSINREQIMLKLAPEYVLPAEKLFTAEMFWDNFTEGFLPILVWQSFLFIPIAIYYRLYGIDNAQWRKVSVFSAGGLMVLVIMMFAPEFALRTGFHSTLFLTVASAAAFKEIAPRLHQYLVATPLRRSLTLAAGFICAFYGLFVMVAAFYVETSYRQQFDNRLEYAQNHKSDSLLVVPAFQIPYNLDSYLGPRSIVDEHLIYAADLESKPTDNRSLMYSMYYNLPPMCIDREVDWKKRNQE